MHLWQHLSTEISQYTQTNFHIGSHSTLGGGCINTAYKVSDGAKHYFVKTNDLSHNDMFESEALALQEMSESNTVLVPKPICHGQTDTQTYIVLEYLHLSGQVNHHLLGQQLASQHKTTFKQFGWQCNNTIGSTPQSNAYTDNWFDFWRDHRLLPQLHLAEKNGFGKPLSAIVEKLLANSSCLFETYQPQASMLHGDLWGGNVAGLTDGTPVIFDPALYYGDRETDIAMTSLFGGFNEEFYKAYNDVWPLDTGFSTRKTFYNLYHIINHLNLFGAAYLKQSISMTEKVLSEI